jgi:type II pantothenate kinase
MSGVLQRNGSFRSLKLDTGKPVERADDYDEVFRRSRAALAEEVRNMSDEQYLSQFKIKELLDQLMCRLLSEKPEDPVTYLSAYLDHLAIEKRFSLQFPSDPTTDLMSFWSPSVVRTNSYSELSNAVQDAVDNRDMMKTSDALISSAGEQGSSVDGVTEPNSPVKLLKRILKSRFDESSGDSKVRLSVGLDIGGSLSKIVFFEPAQLDSQAQHYAKEIEFIKHSLTYGSSGKRDPDLSFSWRKGKFHFLNFETRKFHGAVELLKLNGLLRNEKILLATGGGAQKYAKLIRRELGCKLAKGDELACLLLGINFLLQHVDDECFYLEDHRNPKSEKIPYNVADEGTFPYILVNIGSGVSILLVNDERHFKRVSGTSIGGGTFLGLCKLLTHCATFDEAVEMASGGNSSNIDMTVSDIYGGDYKAFGLKASTVASSFGKCMLREPEDFTEEGFESKDVAVSLLNMISVNIAQLAYLSAMRYKVTRIMFAGNFLRRNPQAMGALSFSINYWSHGVMRALFLKHEGYFGAIGAFLLQEKALLDLFDDHGKSKDSREFES